ncbi:rCG33772 [Rattus norvegicus]|uniref:RCG33772 n=1 Tax=Rattus norvegicus TaxID=10116 RepID=A6HGW1_RAT|nr:rCG33772 [Rattus norvegicus]
MVTAYPSRSSPRGTANLPFLVPLPGPALGEHPPSSPPPTPRTKKPPKITWSLPLPLASAPSGPSTSSPSSFPSCLEVVCSRGTWMGHGGWAAWHGCLASPSSSWVSLSSSWLSLSTSQFRSNHRAVWSGGRRQPAGELRPNPHVPTHYRGQDGGCRVPTCPQAPKAQTWREISTSLLCQPTADGRENLE